MKLPFKFVVDNFFYQWGEDDGNKYYDAKSDRYIVMAKDQYGFTVKLTQVQFYPHEDEECPPAWMAYQEDGEQDPVFNLIDDSVEVEVDIYKLVDPFRVTATNFD